MQAPSKSIFHPQHTLLSWSDLCSQHVCIVVTAALQTLKARSGLSFMLPSLNCSSFGDLWTNIQPKASLFIPMTHRQEDVFLLDRWLRENSRHPIWWCISVVNHTMPKPHMREQSSVTRHCNHHTNVFLLLYMLGVRTEVWGKHFIQGKISESVLESVTRLGFCHWFIVFNWCTLSPLQTSRFHRQPAESPDPITQLLTCFHSPN